MNGPRKHVPIRSCVVCREKDPKRRLTRVVRVDDALQVDPTGKMNGRGAYVCDKEICRERAISTDVFSKALRVSFTEADRMRLRQELS